MCVFVCVGEDELEKEEIHTDVLLELFKYYNVLSVTPHLFVTSFYFNIVASLLLL